AKAAAEVRATSLGLAQSIGARANPSTSAAPSENPASPVQKMVQALAVVIIPTTQADDTRPSTMYGHRLPCNLSAVTSRRSDAGICPELRAVKVALTSSWWLLAPRCAGRNPLRQK